MLRRKFLAALGLAPAALIPSAKAAEPGADGSSVIKNVDIRDGVFYVRGPNHEVRNVSITWSNRHRGGQAVIRSE